jgi:hypothetical protein
MEMKSNTKRTTITIAKALRRRMLKQTNGSRQGMRQLISLAVSIAIRRFSGTFRDIQVQYQEDCRRLGILHVALPLEEYQILVNLRSAGKLSVSMMLSWVIESIIDGAGQCEEVDNYLSFTFSAHCIKAFDSWLLEIQWRGS